MHKSSLLEILRTFSKQELVKFEDFIRSPYFNKKENVLKAFISIKKYSPAFDNENLKKELVWKTLFPKENYNYGIMKNIIFDLNKLAVKFIELENYSQKKFDNEINILEQYLNRNLSNGFEKKAAEIKKHLTGKKISAQMYFEKLSLEKIELEYLNLQNNAKNVLKFDFKKHIEYLNLYYFVNYFLSNISSGVYEFHYNLNALDNDFINSVLSLYEKSDFKNYYTEIFYYLLKCISDTSNEENYQILKNLFTENFDKLSKVDQITISEGLLYYCIMYRGSRFQYYVNEKFQYYKLIDSNSLYDLKDNEKIGYMIINTVVAACTAGEYEWCEKYIEKNRPKLNPEIRDKFTNLAYTHLYFHKKEFEKALGYLSKCGNPTGMEKVNIKTYEIFLYYELKYYDELRNLIDTVKHFIRNDKLVSNELKILYGKFVDIVKKMNDYRYKKENHNADDFMLREIKDLIAADEVIHKGWLKRKLTELGA